VSTNPKTLRRPRGRHGKRETILLAATRVFSEVGYDRSSMDQIAEAAGASKRTVYNHFASKELLFAAVMERFSDDTRTLKEVAYDGDAPLADQLQGFVDAILALTRNPVWLGLMKVIASRDAFVAEAMTREHEREDHLAAWIEAGIDDGRLHTPSPTLAANAFWSMLSGAFLMPAILGQPLPEEAVAPLEIELVALFLARYATRPEDRP